MSKTIDLETEFEGAMREAARDCAKQYKYRPTYFLSMLAERGGVATAKALLSKSGPSSGFVKLVIDYHRPDLTVEYLNTQRYFKTTRSQKLSAGSTYRCPTQPRSPEHCCRRHSAGRYSRSPSP